jgi:hypothetical protein
MGLVQRGMGFSFIPICSLIINPRNLNEVSFVGGAVRSQYFSLSLCFPYFRFNFLSIFLSICLSLCLVAEKTVVGLENLRKNRFFANSRGVRLIFGFDMF